MERINTNNFDFLRVIFASTVAIAHFIELSEIESLKPYKTFFNTRLAINGFFIISGFLIAKSYENSETVKKYIYKRIKRIVPAYFVLIIFCAVFFSFISSNSFTDYFFSAQFWKYLIANLTFQNYLEPCLPGVFGGNPICTINGALWTIKIEEAYYLLVPVFYWLVKSKKINIYFLSLFVFLTSIIYFNYFVSINMYRIAKQLPGALAFFMVGMIFYKKFSLLLKWKHYIILPCLLLFFLEQYLFITHILKPITFGFIVFYTAYSFKWLNNFGKFGDFTYGIYIYHFPIIQIFIYFEWYDNYNLYVISIITFFLILILATLSWHFIELPYLSKGRQMRQKNLFSKSE